jgi:hypothetical protein
VTRSASARRSKRIDGARARERRERLRVGVTSDADSRRFRSASLGDIDGVLELFATTQHELRVYSLRR